MRGPHRSLGVKDGNTFAVKEADSGCLTHRIISAALKAPFERRFLVDLSDVQHIQLNGGTNQGSMLWQPSATSDLVSGLNPLV